MQTIIRKTVAIMLSATIAAGIGITGKADVSAQERTGSAKPTEITFLIEETFSNVQKDYLASMGAVNVGLQTTYSCDAYNIGGYNYIKLRDVADALQHTPKGFSVAWDDARKTVSIVIGGEYVLVGGEGDVSDVKVEKPYVITSTEILANGKAYTLETCVVDGFNYVKLRDIAKILNVGIEPWGNGSILINPAITYQD